MNEYTTAEAAAAAGVNEATIIRWAKVPLIKSKRVGLGQHFVISKKSLEAYLKTRNIAPVGYIAVTTAANYHDNLTASTIRRMAESGKLPSKRINRHLFVEKAAVGKIAETYDADEARRENGRNSVRKRSNAQASTSHKKQDLRPAATPRQIEHDHTLAWIENLVRK